MAARKELRKAGNGEHRNIIRDALGLYGTVMITAVYDHDLPTVEEHLLPRDAILSGICQCVQQHPVLSCIITEPLSESPAFARPPSIQLNDHLIVHPAQNDGLDLAAMLQGFISQAHNTAVHDGFRTPAWKLHVKALTSTRFAAAFAFSHAFGDGGSGLAFHKTFTDGMTSQVPVPGDLQVSTQDLATLPPPLEQAGKLTISWSFLLAPALATYLPKPFIRLFGSKNDAAAKVWTSGSRLSSEQPLATAVHLLLLPAESVSAVLGQCRAHSSPAAKITLTGLLCHVVARALRRGLASHHIPDAERTAFDCGIAIDLRHLLDGRITKDDMANTTSSITERIQPPRENTEPTDALWSSAAGTTAKLIKTTSTLHDQPVGLLSYLSNYRSWMETRAKEDPDSSFEVSNLGAVDVAKDSTHCSMDTLVFSQSADAIGPPLGINVASVKGGSMTISMTWRPGQLGVRDEQSFVRNVCEDIERELNALSVSK